jgi:hypothetical protein
MISGINQAGNTREAINTGRQISGQITEEMAILKEIRIITIINTGTEIGKITVGIKIVGEIITGIMIHIHSKITNIIITIIITGMSSADLLTNRKFIFIIIPGIIAMMVSFSGTEAELVMY